MISKPIFPLQASTVTDVLQQRAQLHGDHPLYTFLTDGEQAESTYTYADLDLRARQIAGWLQGRVQFGDRVLLIFSQGLDYLAAYFGCLYAGVIAVPGYPPRRNRRAGRILSMVRDAGVSVVLTSADLLQQLEETIAGDEVLAGLSWQGVDAIRPEFAENWRRPEITADTIAFLQYTSGSTGDPKGVVVSHGNLLHNQRLIRSSFRQQGEEMVCIGWLPLHHDMGLIGNVLHPLYVGGRLIFMAPIDFLQKPIRWLQTVARYRGTVSGGPNFAYRLCADDIDPAQCEGLDLSSWRVAFNGAEPVRIDVMRSFVEKFRPFGFELDQFCPCYGMAESTLLLTSAVNSEPIITTTCDTSALEVGRVEAILPMQSSQNGATNRTGIELVACGTPHHSVDLRIVDPANLTECQADEVGEIWVACDSIAQGYWGKEEPTRQTFQATIQATHPGEQNQESDTPRYLRTGDLGFVRDGQLYVTGRLKDLIIVNGTNHYPQDIERTIEESHPALAPGAGAAFSVEIEGQERLVAVQEVRRSEMRKIDHDEVLAAIRQAVSENHQLRPNGILLIRPGATPKTTSGKVQRSQARQLYLEEGYKTIACWDDGAATNLAGSQTTEAAATPRDLADALTPAQRSRRDDLRQWLIERISTRLKIPQAQLDIHEPFARYGMDSVTAVRLVGELSESLGERIPPTLAYEYPNIACLSHFLVAGEAHPELPTQQQPSVDEPLAVVGMGCHFPGANSPEEFWNLLAAGRDAIGEIPDHRREQSPNSRPAQGGPTRAGYLAAVDQFDASFFGISPREADCIDPQHRLLLEVIWEAFEDSGIPITAVAGHNVGVFVGSGSNDYSRLQSSAVNGYTATGNSMAMAANRVSYTFDLRGPSLTIDTACSSSLVAVHQACASLRRGECEMAVVGGVNLILSDDTTRSFTQAGMLSPDGVCRAFAAGADGFVRGEGGGVVLLKPLSKALEDGNRVYCVLRGSAVNQDGRTNGLTAPSRLSQQTLIRSALQDAKASAAEIDYVEAHGTGTELGDPIEMRAVCEALEPRRRPHGKLRVGSVKTNIGHLEAAAGIAGLIKVCLSLYHEAMVPHLNFSEPSPHIDWDQPIEVPTALTPWRRSSRPRMAGVSSFGFGGANAHVIVAEAPSETAPLTELPAANLVACSAKTPSALQAQAAQLAELPTDVPLAQLGYSLAAGRSHLKHRLAAPCASLPELQDKLREFAANGSAPGVFAGLADRELRVTWMFSGQGGTHNGAGQKLYESHATFRQQFDQAAEVLERLWKMNLREILWGHADRWQSVQIQPALFCLQYALAQTWWELGVRPSAVVGHSLGEYAAACVAGVFSFEDALRIVVRRAELVAKLPQKGGMLAVFADHQRLRDCLPELGNQYDLAAVNGPRQTVLAGCDRSLSLAAQQLGELGISSQRIQTSHGFHSSLVNPMLDDFEAAIADVSFAPPSIPFISSQTGQRADEQVTSREYWRSNLRNPVQFLAALEHIAGEAPGIGLEVGAGSTLSSITRAAKLGLTTLPGLSVRDDQREKFLANVAQLYVAGAEINWNVALGYRCPMVSLPTYPFEKQRHWLTHSKRPATLSNHRGTHSSHPLLGTLLDLAARDTVFETTLTADNFLADHNIAGVTLFPAAGYLELAAASGQAVDTRLQVAGLIIERPLALDADHPVTVQVVLSANDGHWHGQLVSRGTDGWNLHATWQLHGAENMPIDSTATARRPKEADTATQDVAAHYTTCGELGLNYGPAFRGVRQLAASSGLAHGQVALPEALDTTGYIIHPALLDACLQVTAAAVGQRGRRAWLPVGFDAYCVHRSPLAGEVLYVSARLRDAQGNERLQADLHISGPTGDTVAVITGMQLKATSALDVGSLVFQERWIPRIRRSESAARLEEHSNGPNLPFVEDQLLSKRSELTQQIEPEQTLEMLDSLEFVSGQLTIAALRDMGAPLRAGETFTTQSLALRCGVVQHHHRLLGRLLEILSELGLLQREGLQWTVLSTPHDLDIHELIARVQRDYPDGQGEFGLLTRCGLQLAEVMQSGTDPLPLLFPRDGEFSAADVYRDSVGGRMLNALAAEAIGPLAQSLPPGRGLRILEIGAGTGATTEAILAALPADRVQYVFTDIAPGFLTPARTRFAQYDFVEYKVLDIERDPGEQGFDLGTFDVIVAANVLHATANLQTTLENARRLLNEQGQLVVIEGTRPGRWLDLTFGLTSGWWRFEDTELRRDYPLLPANKWNRLLTANGFEEPLFVAPVPSSNAAREPENSVIVTRLQPSHIGSPTNPSSRNWLVAASDSTFADQLSSALHPHSGQVGSVVWNGKGVTKSGVAIREQMQNACSAIVPTDVAIVAAGTGSDDSSPADAARQTARAVLEILQSLATWHSSPLANSQQPLRVWMVTDGALMDLTGTEQPAASDGLAGSTIWGMLRTLTLENPQWQATGIDLDATATSPQKVSLLLDELLSEPRDDENEIAFRGPVRLVRRLVHADHPASETGDTAHVLKISERGVLTGLTLEAQPRRAPASGEVEIRVHAAGLNFRDVLNALGLYPTQPPLGAECAGVVSRVGEGGHGFSVGDRVAVLAADSICDYITVPAGCVVRAPESLSLQATATVPVTFLTAQVALEELGQMVAGDRVLIHSAAGGVGMAALQLARQAGVEVFATASVSKHDQLRELGVRHVFDSRTVGFAKEVLAATDGHGVDLVLNCLDGSFLKENLAALAKDGRYLDITIPSPDVPEQIRQTRPDLAYHSLDLSAMIAEQPVEMAQRLRGCFERIESGAFSPLPYQAYPLEQAADAMRHMRSGLHVGKIVITAESSEPATAATLPEDEDHAAGSETRFRANANYLITGGLGGLGLLTADWMLRRGAQHIALLARREPNAAEREAITRLQAQGGNVQLLRADVQDPDAAGAALDELRQNGLPLAGVFHLAGVLDDALLTRQTPESLDRVLAPKVAGAWNLHTATLADPLEYFVLYSSAAATFGSPGQANHAAANLFMDALAKYRIGLGRCATSINWGPWSDVGAAAARDVAKRSDLAGVESLCPDEGLAIFDRQIHANGNVPVQVAALRLVIDQVPVHLRERPLFRILLAAARHDATRNARHDAFLLELQSAPAPEHASRMVGHLQVLVAAALGIEHASSIPVHEAPFDLGMDSLTALELTNALQSSLGIRVTTVELFNYPNLSALANRLLEMVELGDPSADIENAKDIPPHMPVADQIPMSPRSQEHEIHETPPSERCPSGPELQTEVASLMQDIRALSDELDSWESSE